MVQHSPDHFMASVKIGPKGQIVIPKEVREMFGIEPGDTLLLLADRNRGIALQSQSVMTAIAKQIFDGKGHEIYPDAPTKDLNNLATAIMHESETEADT